jgi:hypothetical protein
MITLKNCKKKIHLELVLFNFFLIYMSAFFVHIICSVIGFRNYTTFPTFFTFPENVTRSMVRPRPHVGLKFRLPKYSF